MVYPALLPLMCTPRLPVVDWTDAPADLNGLVRFAERRNMVSARVPSHFERSLSTFRSNVLFPSGRESVIFFVLLFLSLRSVYSTQCLQMQPHNVLNYSRFFHVGDSFRIKRSAKVIWHLMFDDCTYSCSQVPFLPSCTSVLNVIIIIIYFPVTLLLHYCMLYVYPDWGFFRAFFSVVREMPG
jgi:hypothetical protein